MTAPQLTDADLDEIAAHLVRCQRHGAQYVSIAEQRVESLLAMARELRGLQKAMASLPPTRVIYNTWEMT